MKQIVQLSRRTRVRGVALLCDKPREQTGHKLGTEELKAKPIIVKRFARRRLK